MSHRLGGAGDGGLHFQTGIGMSLTAKPTPGPRAAGRGHDVPLLGRCGPDEPGGVRNKACGERIRVRCCQRMLAA